MLISHPNRWDTFMDAANFGPRKFEVIVGTCVFKKVALSESERERKREKECPHQMNTIDIMCKMEHSHSPQFLNVGCARSYLNRMWQRV